MTKLYCKNCSEYIGKNSEIKDFPKECPHCGMRFFTDRINKMLFYGLWPGGAQYANGQLLKGSIFGSFAFCGLLFGSLMFGLIVGIVISGLVVLGGIGEGIQKATNMAGLTPHQIAPVRGRD